MKTDEDAEDSFEAAYGEDMNEIVNDKKIDDMVK